MKHPAGEEFDAEPRARRQPSIVAVYNYFRDGRLDDPTTPRAVKNVELVVRLKMRPSSVIAALNWLVENRYLVEHPRGPRGGRRFSLAWIRHAKAS